MSAETETNPVHERISPAAKPRPGEDWETMGQVVRGGETTDGLVRRYAELGLIECRRDSYGRRMFPPGTGEAVKRLKQERLSRHARRLGAV